MRGGIIHRAPPWCLSAAEREDRAWPTADNVPKAADAIGELSVSLAAGFALLVYIWLSAAGIPAP